MNQRLPLPTPVTLTPVTEPDFPVLGELADTIWRQHYAGIISATQIDYMLAGSFTNEALRKIMQAADRRLELLRVSRVGYCAYELARLDGTEAHPAAMKLGQLHALESHRGMGAAVGAGCSVRAAQKGSPYGEFRWSESPQ